MLYRRCYTVKVKISLSGPAALSGNQKRTKVRIAGLALFVALYIGLPAVVEAAYQQFLPGTDIYFGEFVYDDDFVATTTAGGDQADGHE